MSYDPKNPHYDPYTAPPVFDNQPTTGYPDSPGYPDSAPPQQGGYADPYANYTQPPVQQPMPAYNSAGYVPTPMYNVQMPENGLGIAALVLGILGIVMCGIFASIPAVICGHMGVKKADRGEADNRGVAQAGLITGYVGLGIWALIIVFYVVVIVIAVGSAPSTSTGY